MADFLILPDAVVRYVSSFGKIPIPHETDVQALRSVIETIALEVALGVGEAPASGARARD
jgi:hypothetical protein